MYALGIDLGSSSVKVSAVDLRSSEPVGVAQEPKTEMAMHALRPGWAEQAPEDWWSNTCKAIKQLLAEEEIIPEEIKSIGIA